MTDGEFKAGTELENDEDFLVFTGNTPGYTIDRISDEGVDFEQIVVWGDERLRDRIVELLNRYGMKDDNYSTTLKGGL